MKCKDLETAKKFRTGVETSISNRGEAVDLEQMTVYVRDEQPDFMGIGM